MLSFSMYEYVYSMLLHQITVHFRTQKRNNHPLLGVEYKNADCNKTAYRTRKAPPPYDVAAVCLQE